MAQCSLDATNAHTLARRIVLLEWILIGLVVWFAGACGAEGTDTDSAEMAVGALGQNLALNRPAVASSVETAGYEPSKAFDGSTSTRWSSTFSDPQWIYVDLGATYNITEVKLNWEAAYGKAYQIQVSTDKTTWTAIYGTTTGDGGIDDLTGLSGSGRYVRMYGTARGTRYGYSLWELEVYGSSGSSSSGSSSASGSGGAGGGTTNLALNKPAAALSVEEAGYEPSKAFDGSTSTRWSSAFSDLQWIYVDLGATYTVTRVKLSWEVAYGKAYQIQISDDKTSWTTIYGTTSGDGGIDDLTGLSGSGRYVRMYGTARGTPYGYSLWEFEVYGSSGSSSSSSSGGSSSISSSSSSGSGGSGGGTTNLAHNRPASALSVEATGYEPSKAFDGSTSTRWSSAFSDPQWIDVDLGATYDITRVKLNWEVAYGKAYEIQVSADATSWATIYGTTTGDGGIDDLTGLSGSGRYVRMYGTARGTPYGYSLWELEVYGSASSGASSSSSSSAASSSSSSAASSSSSSAASSSSSSSAASSSSSGGGGSAIQTLFVIVMENHDWSYFKGSPSAPYINGTLLPQFAHAENYHNDGLHPSLGNYITLEAGDSLGTPCCDPDPSAFHLSTTNHLVTYLKNATIPWKSYFEGISGTNCPIASSGAYTVHHNPFVYFDDVAGNPPSSSNAYCIAHERPYTELANDLQNNTVAPYNFIVPDKCSDGHDSCSPYNDPAKQVDAWLQSEIPKIMASQAYQHGAILITWDEGDEPGDNPIGMIVVSPFAKVNYANTTFYHHPSTVRTVQEILGVGPLLGQAGASSNLSDLFQT